MRRSMRVLMVAGLLAGLVPLLPVGVAMAADAVVGDGTPESCTAAAYNDAFNTVNSGGGTLTFDCGGPVTIARTSFSRVLSSPVIIDGGNEVTLDGGGVTRLFIVNSGGELELRNIVLANASESGSGGAISSFGDLRIVNSTIRDSAATAQGGAISSSSNATLAIEGSTFTGNTALGGAGAIQSAGPLDIVDSVFNDNNAPDEGGAIRNTGALAIERSSFIGNEAVDDGGAIYTIGGSLEIEASVFDGNHSDESGGAIFRSSGPLEILDTTFSNNSAGNDGGAVATTGIGNSTVYIARSTFSGNTAGDAGGGLSHGGATGQSVATVIASTFSGNTASGVGGGLRITADLDLQSSTVYNNSGLTSGVYASGPVTASGSIVAANTPANCSAALVSNGSNLSDDASCGFIQGDDIENSAAIDLGPLANNGGQTRTHMPETGSDAIDNGSTCGGVDQRGFPRPVGAGCEIGSVELQTDSLLTLCASYYTGRVTSPLSGQCGPGTFELDVPEMYPLTFCIDIYSGILSFSRTGACAAPRQPHLMPDAGNLLTCVSLYTGANRRVYDHSQCSVYELPNFIPAAS